MNGFIHRTLLRRSWLMGILCAINLSGADLQPPVTSFKEFYSLGTNSIPTTRPVEIQAGVLYYDRAWHVLFLQDEQTGFYLDVPAGGFPINQGQKVLLSGRAEADGHGVRLKQPEFKVLSEHGLPVAKPLSLAQLNRNDFANQWVETQGLVQWLDDTSGVLRGSLTDGRTELGFVWYDSPRTDLRQWIGARVRIRGAASMTYENGQPVRANLFVPRREDVEILKSQGGKPFDSPVRTIASVLASERDRPDEPVHLKGVVDIQKPGTFLRLHDETGEVLLQTSLPTELAPGTMLEVVGNAVRDQGRLELANAIILAPDQLKAASTAADKEVRPDPNLPEFHRIADIRGLSPAEAGKGYPALLQGVITFYYPDWNELFVQDDSAGIYVALDKVRVDANVGDQVRLRGVTDSGDFAPIVQATQITRLGKGELPVAQLHSVHDLQTGGFDSQWVEMVGVVHNATNAEGILNAQLSDQTGNFTLWLAEPVAPKSIRQAVVRARGVVASHFNANRELTGIELRVPDKRFLSIERQAPDDLFTLPLTPIAKLRQFNADVSLPSPVRVKGAVTLIRRDGSFYIQEDHRSLLVTPRTAVDIHRGDTVEAVGYAEFQHSSGLMSDALVRRAGSGSSPVPVVIQPADLDNEQFDQVWSHVEGRFIGQIHRDQEVVYMLQLGKWIVEATTTASADSLAAAPRLDSQIGVDGVLVLDRDLMGKVQGARLVFPDPNLLTVIEQPSFWNLEHSRNVAILLFLALLLVVWRTRTAVLANNRLQREINERRAVERDLAHKQHLLTALLENSPDLIYFKDCAGRFVQVNEAMARKAGFSKPSILVSMNNRDIYADETARTLDEDEQHVLTTSQTIVGREIHEVALNGRTGWIQTTIVPHFDEQGAVCGLIGIARDITTRKESEESIAREKQHYQTMFDAMPALVMYKDTCNRALRINRFGAALLGLPAKEIEGRSMFELDPEHADRLYEEDLEIIRSGEPRLGVEEIVGTANGETLWLRTDKLPDRNEHNQIAGVVVFAVDITQQKLAETALLQARDELELRVRERTESLKKEIAEREHIEIDLREQKRFIREVIDSDPNLIFVKDRDGRFTLINRAVAEFFELPEDQIIRKTVADLGFTRASIASVEREDRTTWRLKEQRPPVEECHRDRQGRVRWLQTVKRPLLDHEGRMTHLLGVSVDITDRRHREEELRRTEAFLNSVIQNLPITVFIKDANDLRFVLWNKAGEQLTGYTNAEMLGRTDYDFFPPDEAARFTADDREALRSGRVVDVPGEILRTRNGEDRVMHTRKIPICDEQGRPQYLLGISEDITERKRADGELRAARDAAESANRAKSEFLANMSHEIRTPMNGVIGMTHLLLSSGLNDVQQDYAENAHRCAEGLLTIINDILDFSKIEAGRLNFEHLDFDLREVVESSLDMVIDAANAKSIELGALIASEIDGAVRGDPGRLRQVLLNLLGNAVKFTDVGQVSLSVAQTDESERQVTLHFEVADTGIGITSGAQQRIFRPFGQAEAGTTRKYGGTGLGLVISRQLVQLMGGEMGVTSEPGRGSTFWFDVTLEKQPPEVRQYQERLSNLQHARVLIVDDNEMNRRIVSQHIASWGMADAGVSSGAEALARLRQAADAHEPFDLAILDMQMPEMDGLMLADAIKSDKRIAGTPMILLSSLGQTAPAEELRRRGVARSLTKPVKQSDLYNCLASVLSGESGTAFRARRRSQAVEAAKPKARPPIRILVAEDNPVNQKVATRTLQKLGFEADCVGNGREAISALESILYDVVLMDCNMPELDGYEATRTIRERTDLPQPFIVAMTANAMVGDRERCLAAGMDTYLSKPLRERELDTVLSKVCEGRTQPASDQCAASSTTADVHPSKRPVLPATTARIDVEAIERLRELGEPDGPDLAIEFIDLYLNDARVMLEKIAVSLNASDRNQLKRQAHTLKGSSRNLGAETVAEIAADIERRAEAGDAAVLAELAGRLAETFEATVPLLEAQKSPAASRQA